MSNATADEQPDESGGARSESSIAERAAEKLKELVTKVVTDGVGPITGSRFYAEDRLSKIQHERYEPAVDAPRPYLAADKDDVERTIDRLIAEATAGAGVSGFVTGVGGFVTLPVTIPANLASALVINARLAGAIAHLRGWDINDPYTQTVVMIVALGTSAQQAMRAIGIQVGQKFTLQAIKKLPIAVFREINKRVGFMLVAKFGTQRAAITVVRLVPLAGGLVGGTVDATMTNLVGRTAKKMFERVS